MGRVVLLWDGVEYAEVIVIGTEEDRIKWGQLYMEPVEEGGTDIDEAVKSMTEGASCERVAR